MQHKKLKTNNKIRKKKRKKHQATVNDPCALLIFSTVCVLQKMFYLNKPSQPLGRLLNLQSSKPTHLKLFYLEYWIFIFLWHFWNLNFSFHFILRYDSIKLFRCLHAINSYDIKCPVDVIMFFNFFRRNKRLKHFRTILMRVSLQVTSEWNIVWSHNTNSCTIENYRFGD